MPGHLYSFVLRIQCNKECLLCRSKSSGCSNSSSDRFHDLSFHKLLHNNMVGMAKLSTRLKSLQTAHDIDVMESHIGYRAQETVLDELDILGSKLHAFDENELVSK